MIISDISYTSDFVSIYQKGLEISYELNGKKRVEEFNLKMGSVAILLFHRENKSFLLVKQFRPAIFTSIVTQLPENMGKEWNEIDFNKYDIEIGYTLELCAGLIDKAGLSAERIACEEVAEECGYKIEEADLVPISTFIVGSHQSGNTQHLYYAEIDESMKISEGGGNNHEGEYIFKVELPIEKAKEIIYASNKDEFADIKGPPGVIFSFHWWFLRRNAKINEFLSSTESNYKWTPNNRKTISNIKFSENFDKKKYGYDPKRMIFSLNGHKRTWDLALGQNSVTCIMYDSKNEEALFLQTLRPQVFIGKSRTMPQNINKKVEEIDYNETNPDWLYTLELPVLKIDNNNNENSLDYALKLVENVGYQVDKNDLKIIAKVVPGIGQSGDVQYIYFADVKNATKINVKENEKFEECRVKFSLLPDLFRQPSLGPSTLYFAIGYIIEKFHK